MNRVFVCTPYSGDVSRNLAYAKQCMLDSFERGEAPYASHLIYPQVLDDRDPVSRSLGMSAGKDWLSQSHVLAAYIDNGVSKGMLEEMKAALQMGVPVELRLLPQEKDVLGALPALEEEDNE